jgi:hypothetical protein
MTMFKKKMIFAAILVTLVALSGCGSANDASGTEDSSASGSVASAIGGAYNGSSTSGTQAMFKKTAVENLLASLDPVHPANASSACPTFSASTLASCLSSPVTLTYSSCSFGNSSATWTGGSIFTCSGSVGSPTVNKTYSSGTARTNGFGTVVSVKSSGTSFNGTSVSGGMTLTPSSLSINGVELTAATSGGSPLFDHTITSSALTYSGGVVNGTVTIYHNYAKVIGTAVISSLGFTSGCCTPTSGSIKTTFQAYGVFAAKSGFNGASETLNFTGCGAATYTGPEGYSGNVTLSNCF